MGVGKMVQKVVIGNFALQINILKIKKLVK